MDKPPTPGYPIDNDVFYNSPSFGPLKGKGGDFGEGRGPGDVAAAVKLEHAYEQYESAFEPSEVYIQTSLEEAGGGLGLG